MFRVASSSCALLRPRHFAPRAALRRPVLLQRPASPSWNHVSLSGFRSFAASPSPVSSPPVKKALRSKKQSWTVNGAITADSREIYYYLDPALGNEELLLPHVREGNYVMLYGARASGKTTRAFRAMEQLQDYCCLMVSFQTGIDFDSKKEFWTSFGDSLRRNNKHIDLPRLESSRDFGELLQTQNSSLFSNLPVVLFIDEFDKLYRAPDEVADSILDVLRGIKQERAAYCLQSVVAIGPFSILELTGRSSSPFNVREAVQAPYFTLEEVKELFNIYEEKKGFELDQRIVEDIFTRTAGHAGLVSRCGKAIDETLREDRSTVTYDEWLRYATFKLSTAVRRYPTLTKLIHTLQKTDEQLKAARELLYHRFLPNKHSVELYDSTERRLASFLASEGALRHVTEEEYEIPSPLIRSILSQEVVKEMEGLPVPTEPVPFTPDGALRVLPLLKTVVSHFNKLLLQSSVRESFKICQLAGLNGEYVPQEAVYQSEMERVLASWLPSSASVIPQYHTGGRSRCDLVLIPSPKHRLVLELVASSTIQDIEEHFSRALAYANVIGAPHCWVVHFTVKEESENFVYPYPSQDSGVQVMHIHHNLEFSTVTFKYVDDDGMKREETVSL
eukprot:TRINITY_DN421_c0_g1_i5.p1 TRINITY_DN421_c0_g1~~TRINITY_DN421_c0_g1_i5.p1  ORF type:complete len:618 (+),score=132.83 TRINITY_DN421_c0_g1_i5:76-1929(+)